MYLNQSIEHPVVQDPRVLEVLDVATQNPRPAFLLLSVELERTIRSVVAARGLAEGDRCRPLRAVMRAWVRLGTFPQSMLAPLEDFWSVRNRIAHGDYATIDENVLTSLMSLGIELLQAVKRDGDADGSVK